MVGLVFRCSIHDNQRSVPGLALKQPGLIGEGHVFPLNQLRCNWGFAALVQRKLKVREARQISQMR